MYFLLEDNQFIEILFLKVTTTNILQNNKDDWFVEMEKAPDLHLDMYLYILYKGDTRMIGMGTTITVVSKYVLYVQCEVVE